MKKYLILILLLVPGIAYAVTSQVSQGGTGQSTFTAGIVTSPGGTTPLTTTSTISVQGNNVGIGSPNPGQVLDVAGTVRATNYIGAGTGLTGTASSLTAGNVSTINGLLSQGTNVTITGSGTSVSPYVISSSGGGGSSNWTYSASGNIGLSTTANVGVGTSFIGSAKFTVIGGNVGIGTWVPGQQLDVKGTAKMTGFQLGSSSTAGYVLTAAANGVGTFQAPPWLTGSGVTNQDAVWNNGTLASGSIYDNGDTVGINNSSPVAALDIYDAASTGYDIGDFTTGTWKIDSSGDIYTEGLFSILNGLISLAGDGSGNTYMNMSPVNSDNATGLNMTNDTNQWLFIVNGTNNALGGGVVSLLNITDNFMPLGVNAGNIILMGGTNNAFTPQQLDSTSMLQVLGTEHLQNNLLVGGNVGVGSTAPGGALDVGSGKICLGHVCDSAWPSGGGGGNLWTGTGNYIYPLTQTNNVGIGTDLSPDASLEVTQLTGTPPFMVSSTLTTSGDYMIVANGGNVGIGSITPGQLLDVKGTVRATGFTTNGSGITLADADNIVFNTTTGTKIGTATSQKLAFHNSTPIAQPTGDILTGLTNLGLFNLPTISQADVTFALTTSRFVYANGTTTVAAGSGFYNGTNVGIGTIKNTNLLDVAGGVTIGTTYAGYQTAPTNGIIVQGNVGIGTWATLNSLIVSTGNVGIDTLNPGQALDVNGTVRTTGLTAGTSGITLGGVTNTSWPSGSNWTYTSSGNIGLSTTAAVGIGTTFIGGTGMGALAVMNGNVGIGTWVPGAGLDVHTSGNAFFGGNVGIGSATPGQALDINGTVRALTSGSCSYLYRCVGGVDAGVIQTSACNLCPAGSCTQMNGCF
jgi:hypothetical protein